MLDKFWKNVPSTQTQQMKLKVSLLNWNTDNSGLKESNNEKFKNEKNEGERNMPLYKSTIENNELIKTTNLNLRVFLKSVDQKIINKNNRKILISPSQNSKKT